MMLAVLIAFLLVIGYLYVSPNIVTLEIKGEKLVTLWYTNIFSGVRDYIILWKKD